MTDEQRPENPGEEEKPPWLEGGPRGDVPRRGNDRESGGFGGGGRGGDRGGRGGPRRENDRESGGFRGGPRRDDRGGRRGPRREEDRESGGFRGGPRRDDDRESGGFRGGPRRSERGGRGGQRRDHGGGRGAPRHSNRRDRQHTEHSAQRPSERARHSDPARSAALELLRAVDKGAYANLTLGPILVERGVRNLDAAFATELAYGTVRMRGRYDPVIVHLTERGLSRLEKQLVNALRLGLHQLVAMRVPDHAAVSETVALARAELGSGSAQLVNAILRRAADGPFEAIEAELMADLSPDDVLARRHSHPVWIVRALRQALLAAGRPVTDLEAVLEANNTQPSTTLVARPGLIDRDALLTDLGEPAGPGLYSPHAIVLGGGDPGRIAAVRDGRAAVQDEGSQLVALALTEAGEARENERWLDLCAGPGGKTALLGALAAQRGATVVANEPQPHRADLVRQAVRGLPPDVVEVRVEDGREFGELEPGGYDRVLVDVPCTGLGALRRRPEARWRHTPSDLATLTPLQLELLTSGLAALRPGGVLAYATCTPHIAETRLLLGDALKGGGFELVPPETVPILSGFGDAIRGGALQLWTDLHGTDAMFLALVRRAA